MDNSRSDTNAYLFSGNTQKIKGFILCLTYKHKAILLHCFSTAFISILAPPPGLDRIKCITIFAEQDFEHYKYSLVLVANVLVFNLYFTTLF